MNIVETKDVEQFIEILSIAKNSNSPKISWRVDIHSNEEYENIIKNGLSEMKNMN